VPGLIPSRPARPRHAGPLRQIPAGALEQGPLSARSDSSQEEEEALLPPFPPPRQRGAPVRLVYMQPAELAGVIGRSDVQVIDVGDEDLDDESFPGALHVPASTFELETSSLVDRYAYSGKMLVFHCGVSFHHGPLCASQFIRHLQRKHPNSNCHVRVLQGGDFTWLMTQMQLKGNQRPLS